MHIQTEPWSLPKSEDPTTNSLYNGFQTGPTSTPSSASTAHCLCLSHLSDLIQLISSLVEIARPEIGVSDIGRHTKCEVLRVLAEPV